MSTYLRPFLLLKLWEFVAVVLLGTALIFVLPSVYYQETDLLGALRGGLFFAMMFYVFTLYPLVSLIPIIALIALKIRVPWMLAATASLFVLAYTAFFASMARGELPLSFWTTWGLMGVVTFSLTLWLLRGTRVTSKLEAPRRAR